MAQNPAGLKINLLYQWPRSAVSRLWTITKIFVKEGLLHWHWDFLKHRQSVGGGITLPQSIVREFKRRQISFEENDFSSGSTYDICLVLRDVAALRWALNEKKNNRILKLVAGPLIVNFPDESERIVESQFIDTFLLPSQWIKTLFERLQSRPMAISVWPLGVDTGFWSPDLPAIETQTILVYDKNPDADVRKCVQETLESQHIAYEVIKAGQFTQSEFRDALRRSRGIIFLSRSETQGIAMFEAWSCGVPSLHWNPRVLKLLGRSYDGVSSCPYLTPDCGLDFKGTSDFENQLKVFLNSSFQPRLYVEKNFTIEASVDRLLSLAGYV